LVFVWAALIVVGHVVKPALGSRPQGWTTTAAILVGFTTLLVVLRLVEAYGRRRGR